MASLLSYVYFNYIIHTVDVERFDGLNIRDFSPMKFFMEILLWCISTSIHYLRTAKNSWENFCSELKNRENHESLA